MDPTLIRCATPAVAPTPCHAQTLVYAYASRTARNDTTLIERGPKLVSIALTVAEPSSTSNNSHPNMVERYACNPNRANLEPTFVEVSNKDGGARIVHACSLEAGGGNAVLSRNASTDAAMRLVC